MRLHPTVLALAVLALLSACQAPKSRSTYDEISREVATAARSAAPTATVDDAVANALVPPVSALAGNLPKARPALEERFNVAFRQVPAQQFFQSIVVGTRYNMLVHPDVTGTITANLKDVTLVETLDAIRDMYGYDYQINGTRVSIRPLTMQTRMFQVNYLNSARRGQSSLRVSSTSVSNNSGGNQNGQNGQNNNNQGNNQNNQNQNNGDQTNGGSGQQRNSTDLLTTSETDFWPQLKESIEAIVGSKANGRSVVVSPQSGVLVIRAMPEELRNVDLYLKATQLSVDRQVILEAKILEVELNDSFQSGINWASFATFNGRNSRTATGFVSPGAVLSPSPGNGVTPSTISGDGLAAVTGSSLTNARNAAGSLFGLAFQTTNFAALLSFLESQGTVHVLSSPRIATLNNQKAVLKIGTDEFYVTGVTSTTNSNTTGNTVTPSVTLQPFFSGVVLDVTPQIDDKGNVLLHVHPSVSQVTEVTKDINLGTAGNLTLPLAASATSEIDSMVRGQDGKVVAIGGLMRQSSTGDNSQVPVAGSIPVLGALFRNKSTINQKRELVVLIKPTIVDGANNWNQDLLDSSRRIDELDPQKRRP